MRSQNRKVKVAGRASCLGLLILLALATCPITPMPAFAEGEDVADEVSEEAANNDISVQSDTSSTVGISFSPAKYYAELSPTDNAGQSARIDLQTTIYVYNSGGYSVYLKSDNPNLVGEKDSSNFIPGATVAKAYTDMDVNTWGYAWVTDDTSVPNDVVYKAVSVSGNGDKLAENTNDDIGVDTKTIALSFATKINNEKPADTYSNTMMLSVVSSPREVVKFPNTLVNMQDMTTLICANAPVGATKQLKDVRDGKYYWVSKLADGKCWMTQNLDLDLTNGSALSSTTSDLGWDGAKYPATEKTWNPPYTTATIADENTILVDNTGTRSWSLGNYRIINPDIPSDCGPGKNSAADCPVQFTGENATTPTMQNGDINAHYLLGNHYQWNAATASTGGTITSGLAKDSICPRNWRLPTSTSSGEFAVLVTALGGVSPIDNVTKAPFYGVRGGVVNQSTSVLFRNAGTNGVYWSSTPYSGGNGAYAHALYFISNYAINPSTNGLDRQHGYSVRCIAR